MPFASRRQQRAMFGGHIPGMNKSDAKEWAKETDFSKLPDRAPAEKGKPTLRSKKADVVIQRQTTKKRHPKLDIYEGESYLDSVRRRAHEGRDGSLKKLFDKPHKPVKHTYEEVGRFKSDIEDGVRKIAKEDKPNRGTLQAGLAGAIPLPFSAGAGAFTSGSKENRGRRALGAEVGAGVGGGLGAAIAMHGMKRLSERKATKIPGLAAMVAPMLAGRGLGAAAGNEITDRVTKKKHAAAGAFEPLEQELAEAFKTAALGSAVMKPGNVGKLRGMMTSHAMKAPGYSASTQAMNPRKNVISAMNKLKPH